MSAIRNVVLVAVVVILIGAVLVPIVNDAEKDISVIDVIIVDGQSNAEDWGSFSSVINTEYTATPVNNLYYYGSPTSTTHYTDSAATIATYGLQPMYSVDHWVVGGYGPVLCNEYAAKNGHEVCYINIGYSGQSIANLIPTASVGSWGFGIVSSAINLLKSQYDELNMIGWIWAQGEADKDMAVSTYTTDFGLIQSKFDSYGLDMCYIVHTRDYYGGNANTAQNEIAESDPDVVMTCLFTEDFTEAGGELRSGDPIHYTQKGRNIIAEALAEIIPSKSVNNPQIGLYAAIPFVVIAAVVVAAATIFLRRE